MTVDEYLKRYHGMRKSDYADDLAFIDAHIELCLEAIHAPDFNCARVQYELLLLGFQDWTWERRLANTRTGGRKMKDFPIVPLSKGQLLDVRPEDIVSNGLMRVCDTRRGGGGYDQFATISQRRGMHADIDAYAKQLVVQLHGCNLDCPYCYVTREGVWSKPVYVSAEELARVFDECKPDDRPGVNVFHLMGGAPALYLKHWPAMIEALQLSAKPWIFHSDFLLSEFAYDPALLKAVASARCLYAVNIKGWTPFEYVGNTRKPFNKTRMLSNLAALEEAHVPYYVTFTSMTSETIGYFWQQVEEVMTRESFKLQRRDAYHIDIKPYKALAHVDDIGWARVR